MEVRKLIFAIIIALVMPFLFAVGTEIDCTKGCRICNRIQCYNNGYDNGSGCISCNNGNQKCDLMGCRPHCDTCSIWVFKFDCNCRGYCYAYGQRTEKSCYSEACWNIVVGMGDFIALSMSGVWVGSSTSVKSGCQNEHTYLVEASKFCRSGWYDVTDTNTFKGAGCGTSMYGEYNYELATENKTENPDKKGTYATKCEYLYSE